jgi:hypothetical protein
MASTSIANLIGSQPPKKGIKWTLLLHRLLLPTSTFSQPSPQKLALKTSLMFLLKVCGSLRFTFSADLRIAVVQKVVSFPLPGLRPLLLVYSQLQAAQVRKVNRLLQRLRLKKKGKANVSSVYILVTGEDAMETDTAHTATSSFGSHVPLRRMVPHRGRPVYNVVPRSVEALIPLHPSGSLSNSPSLYQDSPRPRQHHGISKFFGLRLQTPAPAHWVVTSSSSTTR